jgi:hypothetical protein
MMMPTATGPSSEESLRLVKSAGKEGRLRMFREEERPGSAWLPRGWGGRLLIGEHL